MNLEFSPKSLVDLRGILDRIAEDKPKAAVRFVDELEKRCRLLASFLHLGATRDDLLPFLRAFSYRGYAIYYRTLDDDKLVRIERVFYPGIDVDVDLFYDSE